MADTENPEAKNRSAAYILLRKDNTIFMLLRENTGYMDGYYTLPSGKVDFGESFKMAAVREAMEEAGIKINPDKLFHIFTLNRYVAADNTWSDIFFEAGEWEGEPMNAEASKHSWAGWVPIDKLPVNVIEYEKLAIVKWTNGEPYAEIGW